MERISYQEVPQEIFTKLRSIEDYLENSSFEKSVLDLVRLRVSQINRCAYCVDMHHKDLVKLGESDLRLSSLVVWKETPFYSKKEMALLSFAEAVTILKEQPFSDDLFRPLLEFYTKDEICKMTLAISQINTWNRLMKVFQFAPGHYKAN